MAIKWGSASGYMRVGVDVSMSPSTVSSSTSSVSVTVVYYLQSVAYGHAWTSTLHRAGTISGDVLVSFYSATGATVTKEVARQTISVATKYGTSQTLTFNSSLGPIWNGGAPSVTRTATVAARPYQAPAAPSSVAATRASDARINLSWSATATSAAPITQVQVERHTVTDSTWRRVANLSGSARSWSDTSVTTNQRYFYRVRTYNGKTSAWVASAGVSTTPAAPTGVTAKKAADGSITVSWVKAAPYNGTGYTIYDNGTQVGSTASGVLTWVHQSPDVTVTHTYRVTMSETGGLVSALSAPSATVQLQAPPSAPSLTSPVGTVDADGFDGVAHWVHRPVDTTDQTSAQVRFRLAGESSWTTLTVSGDAQEVSGLPTDQGASVEWQARTWGAYQAGVKAGASAWADVVTYRLAARPTVGITAPDAAVTTSTLTVAWGYAQVDGAAQVAATVQLLDESGAVIETRSLAGTTSQAAMSTVLPDGSSWTIRVQGRSADGLISDWDELAITVTYPAPPAPVVEAVWDETTGSAQVQVTNPEPGTDVPAAVTNRIWRSVDSGASWELLDADAPLNTVITDPEALSNGTTTYRVESVSALPSSAVTVVDVQASSWALWISGGPGFSTAVALPWDPTHDLTPDLASRELVYLAGRTRPVELTGVQTSRVIAVQATLTDDERDTINDLAALAVLPAPFLYRDPLGRRMFCSMSGVSLPRAVGGLWSVKATLTEADR